MCGRAYLLSATRTSEPKFPTAEPSCVRPPGDFGGRFRRLNSANLLPALLDLRSTAYAPSDLVRPRPDSTRPTLAPSQRRLTRSDFDLAATRLLADHASLEQRRYPLATGWQWHVATGSQWTPGIGHLRQCDFGVKLLRPYMGPFVAEQDDSLPPSDDATDDDSSALDSGALADTDAAETCNVRLSICYSPSYGVPVLWIEAHKRDGAPLSLPEILRSSILIDDRLGGVGLTPEEQVAADGTDHPATTAPVLLSRADHPATGHFCWFLHPCETEAMVNEILEASDEAAAPAERPLQAGGDSSTWALRWLEAWLMVVGSWVDLQP